MILRFFRSSFPLYGRLAMIASARAGPMPFSVSSCSLLALLMSIRSLCEFDERLVVLGAVAVGGEVGAGGEAGFAIVADGAPLVAGVCCPVCANTGIASITAKAAAPKSFNGLIDEIPWL